MCIRTNVPPLLACTIGDLVPGSAYHDTNGDTCVVTNLLPSVWAGISANVPDFGLCGDDVIVVNTATGTITPAHGTVRLGYDEKGRLYTSRFLNGWYDDAPADDEDGVDLSVDPAAPPAKDGGEWVDLGGEG